MKRSDEQHQTGFDGPLIEPHRSSALAFAQATHATIEDSIAFHQAFPTLAPPGHAFVVFRAPLERGGTGRIAFVYARGIADPAVTVLFGVKPGVVSAPRPPLSSDPSEMRVTVADGVLAAWYYASGEVSPQQIAELYERAESTRPRTAGSSDQRGSSDPAT